MEKLIDIFQKIDNILLLLNQIMQEEYINLLESQPDIKKLFVLVEKKNNLLNQLNDAKKTRSLLENSYNIFPPYLKFNELNYYSKKIKNKCIFLNKINLKNQKLIKNKFYLNQKFLNFYKSYHTNTTYDTYGNLEN